MSKINSINYLNNNFFLIILISVFSLSFASQMQNHTRFEIVIPTYNNETVCIDNIKSVICQDYPEELYHITIVNDLSTDKTSELLINFIQDNNLQNRVNLINNTKRIGALGNFYKVIHTLEPEIVVLTVDGDDELYGNQVLKRVALEYEQHNAWITYGQFKWASNVAIGMCREVPDDIISRNAFRNHTWVFSHLRTFKAWLFQQIKLEDLLCPGQIDGKRSTLSDQEWFYDKAWDLAIMYPMLEMASRGHIKYIPDVLYRYNDLNILNDHKVDAGRVVKLDKYARSRKRYAPLAHPIFLNSQDQKADLIVYSKNRPLQLYSFLESAKKHINGLEKIVVVYACDDHYDADYKKVFQEFSEVIYYRQDNKMGGFDFKGINREVINNLSANYIVFAVDDIIVKDNFDITECTKYLKHTDAYGFFLRLAEHTDYCYMTNRHQGVPHLIPVSESISIWKFNTGKDDWDYPNSLDMTIYKRETAIKALTELEYRAPNSLEANWAVRADHQKWGLCYKDMSKIINIPLNLVNHEFTNNRNMNRFTVQYLIELFRRGLKIDIDKFEKIRNRSAHIDLEPAFINR